MIILSIETSCDETGVAIVESKGVFDHCIIANLVASQIKIHKKYGGVVPGLAAREHVRNLPFLTKKALHELSNELSRLNLRRLDAIAYTDYPGLEPALLVGRVFAKTLAYRWKIPSHPINHLYGHIFSSLALPVTRLALQEIFPAIALVISGGHTQLYQMRSFRDIELLGETVDDAVGEALDKGARLFGLEYPGGPKIELLAKKGLKGAFTFPSPMLKSDDFNFSFAGLKTALLYKLRDLKTLDEKKRRDLAYAYQKAAFDVLREKTKRALLKTQARSLFVGGGVAANQTLKTHLETLVNIEFPHVHLFIPEKQFCTDNAVMIALAYAIPLFSRAGGGKVRSRDLI